jgi:hypothetical protein
MVCWELFQNIGMLGTFRRFSVCWEFRELLNDAWRRNWMKTLNMYQTWHFGNVKCLIIVSKWGKSYEILKIGKFQNWLSWIIQEF